MELHVLNIIVNNSIADIVFFRNNKITTNFLVYLDK
jgi:hypothetical protein